MSGLAAAVGIGCVLLLGFPKMDPTAEALRPRNSPAYAALQRVQQQFANEAEPLWLVFRGGDPGVVRAELERAETVLNRALSNGLVSGFTLPLALWPNAAAQQANRGSARVLAERRAEFHEAAEKEGFEPAALGLTDRILDTLARAADSEGVFWPSNRLSRWVLEKFAAQSRDGTWYALGLIRPPGDQAQGGWREALATELDSPRAFLTGWELLGASIFARVKGSFWKLLVPMIGLVLASLWLAFKRAREVLLSLAVLGLSALLLMALMRVANWSWNLLNLMGAPLILGTGVDYSIFMLLGLRRYNGSLSTTHEAVGKALLLCGATAITGFGALAFSSNAGMASLGAVCAAGIAGNMAIAVFLLPHWWRWVERLSPETDPKGPSSLYGAGWWRAGLGLAARLPAGTAYAIARWLAGGYRLAARHRTRVVFQNLLPVVNGDRRAAQVATRELYSNFAIKLVDLWRYESGLPVEGLLGEATGWEHFLAARQEGRGVLLVTPHLGNWEFGAPFLIQRNVDLFVVTLAEPQADLTRLREIARMRRNIKTLVIGEDPFAFVEIIRRLESGATVALLMDRPPKPTAVPVTLFGGPFPASISAAELARASGCVLLPVYIPRIAGKYHAHILEPVRYDRPRLRDRQARIALTQKLLDAFAPVIRTHLTQWYHFVPLWQETQPAASACLEPGARESSPEV